MKRLLVALIAAAALLAGCAPDSGTVVSKSFTPAHEGTWLWCHPVGKVTVCQPMPMHYDDDWQLYLRDGDDEGWVSVDQQTFNQFNIGDYFAGGE